jgi:hypothetical protein
MPGLFLHHAAGHKKKHTPLTDVLALKDLILHQWYINILLLIIPFAIASEHVGVCSCRAANALNGC